jgi:hypothetical protein
MRNILFISLLFATVAHAQVSQFPFVQNFDSVTPPALPTGWTTTTNRSASGDFKTVSTTVRSAPNAVVDSNSTIPQSLISPILDFSNRIVDSLEFWERRTSAHNSGVLIEASTDSGNTFSIPISDTLQNPGVTTYVRRALALPSSLDNQSAVRIRWRVIGNGTGGSPTTIRFDDIRITVKTQFDAGINSIRFSPLFPVVGDSVTITATVKNYGIQPIQDFLAAFYDDINRDSLPQPTELFDSVRVISAIAQGDSFSVSAVLQNLPLADKLIIVQTLLPNDENPTNDLRIALLTVGVPPLSLVVNEVMYGPTSPEPEWVEITNVSSDSVNLRQWKIADRNTANRSTITARDFFLPPGRFAVVAKDSAVLLALHPEISSRVFHVPTLATLNNDSDAVVFFDHRGVIIDSVHYRSSWGGTSGRSLERIDARGPSLLQSNWGSSTNPARSTPGRKNSLTPKDFDVAVSRIAFAPNAPIIGDSVIVSATIKNPGLLAAQNILVEFFEDANSDSLPQPQERFGLETIAQIVPDDSVVLSAQQSSLALGDHLFIVRAELSMDEDTTNNIKRATVSAGYPAGTIVINEIMYAPVAGEPEWVEFLNVAADSVNLKNWRVSNRTSSTRYAITSLDVMLRREGYAVITKDTALFFATHPTVSSTVIQSSSMPTFLFNNNGDAVVLFDSRGAVMDSVQYMPTWGGTNGKSLERIDALFSSNDSTNWGSSQDSVGSTPGRYNSLTPVEYDLRATRINTNVNFPSLDIHVVVTNVGREAASGYAVALFHDANGDSLPQSSELLERRTVTSVLQPRDSLVVDFTWSEPGYGQKRLIATVEYPPDLRPSNNTVHGLAKINYPERSLVINEIMYQPFSGQAEYVELYNRSQLAVDLRDWKISDMRTTSGVANEFTISRLSYVAQPGSHVVVSSDSSVLQYFSLVPDSAGGFHLFILNRSNLSLNNDGDDVVLTDLTGSIIDSVRYASSWHNAQVADVSGRALERINPELPSTDRRNWSTSAHYLGGTPGKQNSIYTASVPTSASLSFSPNPFSPDGDGFEDFTLISYEVPSTAALLRIRIFDAKGRLIRTLVNGEPTGARGSVVWDGMNDSREKVRMGIYVVLLEALHAGGTTIHSTKAAVVVAVRL